MTEDEATLIAAVARAMFEHDQIRDETKLAEWPEFWEVERLDYLALAEVAVRAYVKGKAALQGTP